MWTLATKVPNKICIAFSGGVDSLAAAHFFKRGRKDVILLHYNHGNSYSDAMESGCIQLAKELSCSIVCEKLTEKCPEGTSKEAFWRNKRYAFLKFYAQLFDRPVITCHHLDDAVETWVWSSVHGQSKLIPKTNDYLLRPFLLTKKASLERYCREHDLCPVIDPSNEDTAYMRNYMRKNMMQYIYHINPGIDTVVRKKYLTNPELQTKED